MKNLTKTFLAIYIAIMCVAVACKKDEVTPTPTPITPPVVTKSSAKDITKFSFAALSPAVDATIDATNKTISATVPAATDVSKLVPTITLSDKATVSPATGVAQDFSKEVSYTVTAEDGSTAVWKVGVKKDASTGGNSSTLTVVKKATLPSNTDLTSTPVLLAKDDFIYLLGSTKQAVSLKYVYQYNTKTDVWTKKSDINVNLGVGTFKMGFTYKQKSYVVFRDNDRLTVLECDFTKEPIEIKTSFVVDGLNDFSSFSDYYSDGKIFLTSSFYKAGATNQISVVDVESKGVKNYDFIYSQNTQPTAYRSFYSSLTGKFYLLTVSDSNYKPELSEFNFLTKNLVKKLSLNSTDNVSSDVFKVGEKIYFANTKNYSTKYYLYDEVNEKLTEAKTAFPNNFYGYSTSYSKCPSSDEKTLYILNDNILFQAQN